MLLNSLFLSLSLLSLPGGMPDCFNFPVGHLKISDKDAGAPLLKDAENNF